MHRPIVEEHQGILGVPREGQAVVYDKEAAGLSAGDYAELQVDRRPQQETDRQRVSVVVTVVVDIWPWV